MSDRRQKTRQMMLAFSEESRGEAPRASGGGSESLVVKRQTESPAPSTERLMEEVAERGNLNAAYKRVKANGEARASTG